MNVLAVIPARGGSKGIPRKNMRLLDGKPLIAYCLNSAKRCDLITHVAVTSEDEEILAFAKKNDVYTIVRPTHLSDDAIALDPVIYDATINMERLCSCTFDIVVTLQPTSPLMQAGTLQKALADFINDETVDTIISGVSYRHLSWGKNDQGYYPLYKQRLNRQLLPEIFVETGAFVITRREFVSENTRFGKNIQIMPVPSSEAVDIDTVSDWVCCEATLKRKKILFRVDGYRKLGMGHIYRCLTLAYNLINHDVIFVLNKNHAEGVQKIKDSNMPFHTIDNDEGLYDFIGQYKPDIVVNDLLDSSTEYMKKLKSLVSRVISIEDIGEGARFADAVINALYETTSSPYKNTFSGERFVCLRDEFLIETPKPFSDRVKNAVVLFGGADPGDFTRKVYDAAILLHDSFSDIQFVFLAGLAYSCQEHGVVSREDKNIVVYQDVKNVSTYLKQADIALSSQGRTMFELASLGVPTIILAQNERELLHRFGRMENGFVNLGLGKNVSCSTIISTFEWLAQTPQIRREMRSMMLSRSLKSGIDRVTKIILGETL